MTKLAHIARALWPWGRGSGAADVVKVAAAPVCPKRTATAALLRGVVACQKSDTKTAFEEFQRAFIGYCQAEDRRSSALVQKTIGLLILKVNNPAKVRMALKSAQRMLRQAGLRDEEARALFFAADFEARQQAYRTAYHLYDESVRLSNDIAYTLGEVEGLCRYAMTEALRGRNKEVDRRLEEAVEAAKMSTKPEVHALLEDWTTRIRAPRSVAIGGAIAA